MSTYIINVAADSDHPGTFNVTLDGQKKIVCRSRQPLLDGARALARLAITDREAEIVMRHAGSDIDALRAKLAEAAALTVVERKEGMRFERWHPSQRLEASKCQNNGSSPAPTKDRSAEQGGS